MEERVPEGRERRRWLVHGFNARKDLFRRILTLALAPRLAAGEGIENGAGAKLRSNLAERSSEKPL
jgi:hypothetical protein